MSFWKNIFGKKEEQINTYNDFWNWFRANEFAFYNVVKKGKNLEKEFFDKLSSKLEELKNGFYYTTGMSENNTVELVFTADGAVKNIVFVEELVKAAPNLLNWKFIALKPPLNIENVRIEMSDYSFDTNNLSFYAIEHKNYPDEIDLAIIHHDFKEEDKSTIANGTFIFLDNYLGELNFINSIDNSIVISKEEAEKELIPISKLKSYLKWREKEFIEKYNGLRYNTGNDKYTMFEAELISGKPLIAIINKALLEWDSKPSHPWILKIEIKFDGNINGMPENDTYELLNKIEDEIMLELKDFNGYLNIGRQTADNERVIYFACQDFRKPSIILHELTKKYSGQLDIGYMIYKDKYWRTFEKYRPN